MATWARRLGLALALAIVTVPIVRGDDAKVNRELKKLKGAWVNDPNKVVPLRWEFDGDTLKSTVAAVEYTSKVKVEPDASPHSTIEFEVTEGPEIAKGKVARGIYKLVGDTLTICVAVPDKVDPPADFKAVEEETFLFELQREKK